MINVSSTHLLLLCQYSLQNLHPPVDTFRNGQPQYPAHYWIDVNIAERRYTHSLFESGPIGVEDGVHFQKFRVETMFSPLPKIALAGLGDSAAIAQVTAVFG